MNASRDLSDLILRREWDRLAKKPGDQQATERIAQETTRRTDLKMNYEGGAEIVIEPAGTMRANP